MNLYRKDIIVNCEKSNLKNINSIFSRVWGSALCQNLDNGVGKKILTFFLLFFLHFILLSQSSVVIKDNAYMVLNTAATTDSVFVVLDNENTNALATSGGGGNIITKNEKNQIKWNIGTSVGEYTIPFTTATNETNDNANNKASESKIPLTVNITGAGTGAGNIKFSSYTDNDGVDNWRVSDYKPSDVTNLNRNGVDNSNNVVDRFWIIDANGYDMDSKPDVTLSFTYDEEEAGANPTNTLIESDIIPQRWNSTSSRWDDLTIAGTLEDVGNTFSDADITPGNFFRSWVLVSSTSSLLPVHFVSLDSKCIDDQMVLKWTTATEINNSHFEIEYSTNGKQWNIIDTIYGSGTSAEEINYQYEVDKQNTYQDLNYYRLKQVDYDGTYSYSEIEIASCDEAGEGIEIISLYPNPSNGVVNILIHSTEGGVLSLKIYDSIGRLIIDDAININRGTNLVDNFIEEGSGRYFISASINNGKYYDYSSIVVK